MEHDLVIYHFNKKSYKYLQHLIKHKPELIRITVKQKHGTTETDRNVHKIDI